MLTRRNLLWAPLVAPALILPRRSLALSHGKPFAVPAVASANGLNRQVFFDNFTGNTVDLNSTGNPGYNWYLNNAWPYAPPPFSFWGDVRTAPATPASNISFSRGINTKNAARNGAGAGSTAGHFLQTAQANGMSYVGQAFGLPLYIQYSMAVQAGSGDSLAWPALWIPPLEFFLGQSPQWTEVDCMEYYLGSPGQLIMTVHYNDFNAQTTGQLNDDTVTNVTDSNFHTYGVLWLPAAGAVNGNVKYYLDGVEQTGAAYSYASGSNGSWSDALHMMIVITPGDNQTASWDYIGVWT